MMAELPELRETSVRLARGRGAEAAAEATSLRLVHVADPRAGVFSQAKKQCDLWEFVWGTSLLLASLLARVELRGCEVLEVGGGSGLCSLAAALSAERVTMTDLVEDAVRMCQQSARANTAIAPGAMAFARLDWNKPETVPAAAADVVIASDVLFFRGAAKPVALAVHRALRDGGLGVLADPFRLATDDFEAALLDLGVPCTSYLFVPELLREAQNLQHKAFVDVKKVKLLVFRKPGASAAADGAAASLGAALPAFVVPGYE